MSNATDSAHDTNQPFDTDETTSFLDRGERQSYGSVLAGGSSDNNGENPAASSQTDNVVENPEQTTPAPVEDDVSAEGEETRDGAIGTLTRRLRCLFSTITWPIVPLGTIVALALLWVLYAASSLDLRRSCSHPLHWYALASLILVAYIPHHAQVRSHLFNYSRERDGPIRPARVRIWDQGKYLLYLAYPGFPDCN